jgi:hypothetical protein
MGQTAEARIRRHLERLDEARDQRRWEEAEGHYLRALAAAERAAERDALSRAVLLPQRVQV